MSEFSVGQLDCIIRQRLSDPNARSYTRSLAEKGRDKCAEKFGEEAVEAIVAAVKSDPAALKAEAADVIYHLLVLLAVSGLAWSDVLAELEGRTAQSGLDEKQSRLSSP